MFHNRPRSQLRVVHPGPSTRLSSTQSSTYPLLGNALNFGKWLNGNPTDLTCPWLQCILGYFLGYKVSYCTCMPADPSMALAEGGPNLPQTLEAPLSLDRKFCRRNPSQPKSARVCDRQCPIRQERYPLRLPCSLSGHGSER